MPIEVEAKFLDINRTEYRKHLADAGFICLKPDFLMKRVVFDIPGAGDSAWARVRDEGDKITVSYKNVHNNNSVNGVEEISLVVNDFSSARHLLSACGLVEKAYQETRRELWRRDDVEASIDEWPALPPFIEIEGMTENTVRGAASSLGLSWETAVFGAVDSIYERYGIPAAMINQYPRITFENVLEINGLRKAS